MYWYIKVYILWLADETIVYNDKFTIFTTPHLFPHISPGPPVVLSINLVSQKSLSSENSTFASNKISGNKAYTCLYGWPKGFPNKYNDGSLYQSIKLINTVYYYPYYVNIGRRGNKERLIINDDHLSAFIHRFKHNYGTGYAWDYYTVQWETSPRFSNVKILHGKYAASSRASHNKLSIKVDNIERIQLHGYISNICVNRRIRDVCEYLSLCCNSVDNIYNNYFEGYTETIHDLLKIDYHITNMHL